VPGTTRPGPRIAGQPETETQPEPAGAVAAAEEFFKLTKRTAPWAAPRVIVLGAALRPETRRHYLPRLRQPIQKRRIRRNSQW